MSSLENNCESVIMAILAASADLLGFAILHQNEDEAANKDRIVVSSSPREIALHGKDESVVKAWGIKVAVEVFFVTRAEATYDAIVAAIQAAMGADTPPASVNGLWVSSFPFGARIEPTSDGDDETEGNTRTRTKTFLFVVGAS